MRQDIERLSAEADRLRTLAENFTDGIALEQITKMVEELEARINYFENDES